jgi:hypothetical protein
MGSLLEHWSLMMLWQRQRKVPHCLHGDWESPQASMYFQCQQLVQLCSGPKPSLPPSDLIPVQIYAFAESDQPYQQSLSSCFPDVKQCNLEMMDLNLPLHLQSETNVCWPRERQGTWALKTIPMSPNPRILRLGKVKIQPLPIYQPGPQYPYHIGTKQSQYLVPPKSWHCEEVSLCQFMICWFESTSCTN